MLENAEGGSDEENEWADQVRRHRQRLHHSWVEADHPGCQLSGHLLLDRVPGNFHIQARSPHHDLVPHLTNVSHVIHAMSIGEPVVSKLLGRGIKNGNLKVPVEMETKIAPMDGNAYINTELHEASTPIFHRMNHFSLLDEWIVENILSLCPFVCLSGLPPLFESCNDQYRRFGHGKKTAESVPNYSEQSAGLLPKRRGSRGKGTIASWRVHILT